MRQEVDYGQFRYEGLSLLWPQPQEKTYFELSRNEMEDLNIKSVYEKIMTDHELDIFQWLKEVPADRETSIYRQQVMRDLIENKGLYEALFSHGDEAHQLMTMSKFAFEKEATLYNLLKRTDEVEHLKTMLNKLLKVLQKADLTSQALIEYRQLLTEIVDSPIYEAFTSDVQTIKDLEEGVKSLKIGLNLDEYLRPVEAILLELSDEEFKYDRFFKKMGYYIGYGIREIKQIPRKIFAKETILPPDALNTLEKTIEPATLQLITFCDQFTMKIMEVISVLYHDLPYFRIGLDCYYTLKNNEEPIALPTWESDIRIESLYHISLGFDQKEIVVKNPFAFHKEIPRMVLTGANRGGKTTFTQALAINLWFAQLGFYVPAKLAVLPYIDQLIVHFPREEKESVDLGRLGEECHRFKGLYDKATENSFFVMNESFQGTSHNESLQIALETMKALMNKGCYVLFNTHLHELVETIERNDFSVISLIAGKDMKKSPYLIEEGRPLGKSYAIEIAKRYGMLYDQLIE